MPICLKNKNKTNEKKNVFLCSLINSFYRQIITMYTYFIIIILFLYFSNLFLL